MTDLRYDLRHVPTNDDWHRSYDEKRCTSAAIGSDLLKHACERMYRRFEIDHNFPPGFGEAILLQGYR